MEYNFKKMDEKELSDLLKQSYLKSKPEKISEIEKDNVLGILTPIYDSLWVKEIVFPIKPESLIEELGSGLYRVEGVIIAKIFDHNFNKGVTEWFKSKFLKEEGEYDPNKVMVEIHSWLDPFSQTYLPHREIIPLYK